MNRWTCFALLAVALGLTAGCVYVPPYYDEPFSPSPWGYPLEPYPPRGYAFHQPPPPYTYRQRRLYDRDYRLYRPDVEAYRDTQKAENRSTPPSKIELPDSGRPPESGKSSSSAEIPTASRGSKPGRVRVPFAPYNELDVTGMTPGSLAKDPTSGKVFRLPN